MPHLIAAAAVRGPDALDADALVIDGGRITEIGQAASLRADGLDEQAYPGATVVPGLRDAHLHPVGLAATLSSLVLDTARDFSDLADLIGATHGGLPPGTALMALRLDDERLVEGRLPDRTFVDAITGDRPTLLVRHCGHIAVANTAALELAGVSEDTPDPAGGAFDREAGGWPTGVLRETAIGIVNAPLVDLAPAVVPEQLVAASHGLASVGLTGIGAMVWTGEGPWATRLTDIEALVATAGELAVEVDAIVTASSVADLERAAVALSAAGGRVRFAGVKMFSDGSLGGHTAAMHSGFSDMPHELGIDRLDPDWAYDLAKASLALGGLVAIHAIGDRANSNVLDLMERLIREGTDPARLRVEHASVLTEPDIERFGRLGITASVQPAFLPSDGPWLTKRLGPDRLPLTYAFRSLLDAGAPLAGGSDSPVEPPHPLWGMAHARDRFGIVPEEALTAAESLDLFTTGSATALGSDATLRPGAPATFTVLDIDPVTATPDEVRNAVVLDTWIDGERVNVPPGTKAWP